jgi:hypothetical protein
MPQFNQINNNASFDQSLMSQSYIDGLGAVAERRSKERERQTKMINAVKLAMDRLGVVGNKAFVNEDGVIDARFNTFDGRKKYGETTDFGYADNNVGKNTTTALVDNGGNAALANIASMNAAQPIGSPNGILPLFNSVTQTGGAAGSIIQLGRQGMQQVLQQPTTTPPAAQQQTVPTGTQQQQGVQQTTNAITGLLKGYQSAVGKTANLSASYGGQGGLNMTSQQGVLTTTQQGSKVTDANPDLGTAALESSAILEQAILGSGGPIAEALKNKYETIRSADKARSSDGTTESLTSGNYSVGSTVSVNGSVGVGQSVNINNSSNLSGPTNTPTGSTFGVALSHGTNPQGGVYSTPLQFSTNPQGQVVNANILNGVVSTGKQNANVSLSLGSLKTNKADIANYYKQNFNVLTQYDANEEITFPNGKKIKVADFQNMSQSANKELKDAINGALTKVGNGQGRAIVATGPDGTEFAFGVVDPGQSKGKNIVVGVTTNKIGNKFLDKARFDGLIQTFFGGGL